MNLIGTPVKAYGCASGLMRGKIMALFYRYKAACGKQYVADFLIGKEGSDEDVRFTQPGDSGTIWHLDIDADTVSKGGKLVDGAANDEGLRNMPIAVQWGGHSILHGPSSLAGGPSRSASCVYALASSLSSALNILDVELVVDWQSYLYWGDVGHYLVAYKAIGLVQDPILKKILTDHVAAITFSDAAVAKGKGEGGVQVSSGQYVPLADVPDLVWKTPQRKPRERPNHFVEIDRVSEGKTMIEMIKEDPTIITDVSRWLLYYDGLAASDMGLLHFRVWQLYDLLVEYITQGDVPGFIATAGILSHYVGDACQPLHASGHHDGEKLPTGKKKGKGVHSKYESQMVASHSATLLGYVDSYIEGMQCLAEVHGGKNAAQLTMELILRTATKIPPLELTDTYATGGTDAVWKQYGELTGEVMADGSSVLAKLWDCAWQEGHGKANINYVGTIDNERFWKLYSEDSFLPSFTLDHIANHLKGARKQ